jgi:hypothetical protein
MGEMGLGERSYGKVKERWELYESHYVLAIPELRSIHVNEGPGRIRGCCTL